MKLALIITAIFSLLMTVSLIGAKNEGLHPDMKAFALMIPFIGLFVWSALVRANIIK